LVKEGFVTLRCTIPFAKINSSIAGLISGNYGNVSSTLLGSGFKPDASQQIGFSFVRNASCLYCRVNAHGFTTIPSANGEFIQSI